MRSASITSPTLSIRWLYESRRLACNVATVPLYWPRDRGWSAAEAGRTGRTVRTATGWCRLLAMLTLIGLVAGLVATGPGRAGASGILSFLRSFGGAGLDQVLDVKQDGAG